MEAARNVRPLVAGNWKMNGLRAQLSEAMRVRDGLSPGTAADVMICPPVTLVQPLAEAARGSRLLVGAQDCHRAVSGAHTGDISAEMLADAGAVAVIVGHSERRAAYGELDSTVRLKAEAAHRARLLAIVCLGETAGERAAGLTLEVVRRQLQVRCPLARAQQTRPSPTSPSGPSARGARRPPPTSPRCTAPYARPSSRASAPRAGRCASSTAAPSTPQTRASYWPSTT